MRIAGLDKAEIEVYVRAPDGKTMLMHFRMRPNWVHEWNSSDCTQTLRVEAKFIDALAELATRAGVGDELKMADADASLRSRE